MYVFRCNNADIITVDMCTFRHANCTNYDINYPRIELIYLINNQISYLHEDTFISVPNVELISLNQNNLTSIPYLLFSNNHKLTFLDLNENNIKIFIIELSHILHLNILSLAGNPIETFHEGTLKTFFMHNMNDDKYMSFDNLTEHLKCYCNIAWLIRIKKYIVVRDFDIRSKIYNLTEVLKLYDSFINKCNLNNTIELLNNTTTNNTG